MQRVAGALFSPGETFADIARRPDILVPLVIIMLVALISTIVVVPRLDFESMMREQLEQNPNMSQEDIDRVVRFGAASGKVFAYASPILNIAILAIIAGVLLLAFRLFGGEGNFKQAFSVTLYGWLPFVIKGILATIIALSRQTVSADQLENLVKSNLGAFVDPKQQMVAFALLSSIDLFTIWVLVLLIIGFAHVSRLSRAKSAAIVVSLWLVTVIFRVGLAALGAARMQRT